MKIITALLLLPALLLAGITPQQDNTPAPLEYIDAQVNVMVPRLVEFQDQYLTRTGHYFQALESNSTAPDVPVVPDGISGAPTDQEEDLAFFWDTGAELPDVLAWSFNISTYAGPDGSGYVLTISTSLDGVTWKRAQNFGPEEWRGSDWYPVVPFEFPY